MRPTDTQKLEQLTKNPLINQLTKINQLINQLIKAYIATHPSYQLIDEAYARTNFNN